MNDPIQWMQRAIALADRARLQAPPNPWVGCVIVKEGKVVGEGCTQRPGQAHAEIGALAEAKERARGASLYVTLEPCCHMGRTPPCTEALIRAGIREVYIGLEDPDPQVKGKGMAALEAAGIRVIRGLGTEEIQKSLAPYLYQRRTSLPYTVLKSAISLDGRTAAADGTSQWITDDEARKDAHLQRAHAQAILIGAGTALRDLPRLTVRHPQGIDLKPPLRVLLDALGKVPAQGPLFDPDLAPTLVVTTSHCPEPRRQEWLNSGAEVVRVPPSSLGVDLEATWQLLGARSLLQVLVEGGTTLHTTLLQTRLVNRLLLYVAPLLLGASGYPLYAGEVATLSDAKHLSLLEAKVLGKCVRLEYTHQATVHKVEAKEGRAS